jgi:hypothetical protein
MKNKTVLLFILLIINQLCIGQSITIVPESPTGNAVVDLSSTTKGFLPPRMTAVQKGAVSSPTIGLIIYQTDEISGLYIYTGTTWALTGTTANAWGIAGNAGTNPALHFMGTTDNNDVIFKRNNVRAGKISSLSTSFGLETLNFLTTGTGNSAFGNFSLWANSTGLSNTSTGDNSLFSNSTGNYNTANGYRVLYNNTVGNENTAYGSDALLSNQASSNNTAIGNQALMYNQSGESNTALGYKVLKTNTGGGYNTAIGSLADVATPNLSNATAIGANAQVASSNSLILGSIAGINGANYSTNVGIGITRPQAALHINPTGFKGDGGLLLGEDKETGSFTTLEIGISKKIGGYGYLQARQKTEYGGFNILLLNPLGGHVGVNHKNNDFVEAPLDIDQSYEGSGLRLRYKSNDWDIHALENRDLAFSYASGLRSWIYQYDGSWNTISDKRLKKNVNRMENVMDKVLALQPKTYQYIDAENTENANKTTAGFIAQEVALLFPELVNDFKHPRKDTADTIVYHGINYAGFGIVAIKAIKAIQEQQQEIEVLKAQIKVMMAEIERLKHK